jgi:hypothetical protein
LPAYVNRLDLKATHRLHLRPSVPSTGDTIADMDTRAYDIDWFDRLVAMLFATIVVLGLAIVATALVLFFPGASTSNIPLP